MGKNRTDNGHHIQLVLSNLYFHVMEETVDDDELCVCVGMPPPSGVGIGSPMHPSSVDRKRPPTADPRLAQQMKLWVSHWYFCHGCVSTVNWIHTAVFNSCFLVFLVSVGKIFKGYWSICTLSQHFEVLVFNENYNKLVGVVALADLTLQTNRITDIVRQDF